MDPGEGDAIPDVILLGMTLIIGTLSRRYAIQVSDRRTTSTRGVESEKVTKALTLTCEDGRFAVGYSGLAKCGTFDTRNWIIEAFKQCGPADFTARGIVNRFVDMASADFARIPDVVRLPGADRRLTLMLTGFVATAAGTIPTFLFVSNFQDFERYVDSAEAWERFRFFPYEPVNANGSLANVQRIGAYREVGPREWNSLKAMLEADVPPDGLVGKMVDIIREASSRLSARGTIGRNALSCVIPADFAVPLTSGFYSAETGHVLYMADAVVVTRGIVASAADMQLAAADPGSTPPLVVPKQRRSEPCACGSGKKYKACHGR